MKIRSHRQHCNLVVWQTDSTQLRVIPELLLESVGCVTTPLIHDLGRWCVFQSFHRVLVLPEAVLGEQVDRVILAIRGTLHGIYVFRIMATDGVLSGPQGILEQPR